MIPNPNEPFNLNQSGRPTVIPKTSILKIIRIALLCVIAIIGTTFSFVLYSAFGWIIAVIAAVFFIGIGFLANFVVGKILSLNFNPDTAKKIEHTGVLTKKWWVEERVQKEGLQSGMEHVYYITLNEKTFKIGDSYNGNGAELYDSLKPNKTYKLAESAHHPGYIFSVEEVKIPTVKRSTDLGF